MTSTDRGRLIDISQTVQEDTVVWPGDTPFSREWVMTMEGGCSCNVSTIRMSVHCGTHSDAPYHFIEDGIRSADVSLEAYIGPCLVIEAGDEEAVRASDLDGVDFSRHRRFLFKTRRPCTATTWRDDFTYMGVDAAERLVEGGAMLVGLDTPSMDAMDSKTLDAHKVLCSGGLALLENLDLAHVEPGAYELIAPPIKVGGSDSAPVRAILRTL